MNSLACLFDSLISARPTSIGHFWPTLCFGAFYLMVNLLYWVNGGLGLCKIHCVTANSNLNVTDYTTTLHNLARPPGVSVVVQACDESPPCDSLVRKLFPFHLLSRSATRFARTTSILRLTGVANLAWQLPFPVLSLLPFPLFRFTKTFSAPSML